MIDKKSETLKIYMTPSQKEIIVSKAAAVNKTMSDFMLSASLDQPFKIGGERLDETFLHFMTEQQKMMHIIARLTLYIGGEQTSPDQIMEFFKQCKTDAEKLYGNGSAN